MANKKFLTPTQTKELQSKNWYVNERGAYLTLYVDDFINRGKWQEVCQQLEVDPDTTESVNVLYFGIQQFDC